MGTDSPGTDGSAVDRWDKLHQALASQKRRMIIYSLLDVPDERRVPLPEAAIPPGSSVDYYRMTIALQHAHLPQLADAGYVRWEREPFCVQRGPRFEEVEAIFRQIHDSIGRFPESLIQGCEVYEELYQDVEG